MQINSYSEITPEILDLSRLSEKTSQINTELYKKYDVKRGLRDISGQGVLAGLTEIGEIHAYDMVDGKLVPCEGKLFYRGMDIEELASRKSPICCSLGNCRIRTSWPPSGSFWAPTVPCPPILSGISL